VGKQNTIIYRSLEREKVRGEVLRGGRFFMERIAEER
jgi:hypothetical protein